MNEKMKKAKGLLSKNVASKWFIILVCAILLIACGRVVDTGSLSSTGIILGLGIDYSDGEYEVSAQSVISSTNSSSGDGGSAKYLLYKEKDKSLLGAMDKISAKMGLNALLSHCHVVVLSNETLKLNHEQLFVPLVRKLLLPAQSVVVTSVDAPDKLLSAKIAGDITTAFYLQSVLLADTDTNGIMRITVKELLAQTMSFSAASFVPQVELIPLPSPPVTPAASTDGSSQENKENTLKLSEAVVFNQSFTQVIDEDMTKAATLLASDIALGSLSVTLGEKTLIFKIRDQKTKLSASGRTVTGEIKITAEFQDAQGGEDGYTKPTDSIVMEAAKEIEKKLQASLTDCFELSKRIDVDFLGLKNVLYRKESYKLEKDCLDTITFLPEVKIEVKEHE